MAFVCMHMCMHVRGHTLDISLHFFMKTKKEIISVGAQVPGMLIIRGKRQKEMQLQIKYCLSEIYFVRIKK